MSRSLAEAARAPSRRRGRRSGIARYRGLASLAAALVVALGPSHAGLAADPSKVLHWAFPAAETGFDPARVHDYYSSSVTENVFERLVDYDYLARPAKLVPGTALRLPEVSADGRSYTFTLRRGIRFSPDPALRGEPRELTAEDYAYSIKRLMDPAIHSPWQFLVEGKIVGLDALAESARRMGRFDYDAPVEGLVAADRYTLRIRLTRGDFNFSHILAMPTFGAVAREVVDAYGDDINAHPVGTGAYRLERWVRSSKIELEANPDYRGFVWNFRAGPDAEDAAIVASMAGKKMPQIGRVEISIMEEDEPRWLAFRNGQLDVLSMEGPLAPEALDGAALKPALADRGVKLSRLVDPEIVYTYWNLQDPVVGGMTKEKIALRRAMAMSYDVDKEIRIVRNNQAVAADFPIPPGVVGHDPDYRSLNGYSPELANRLLDWFGYARGEGGWRNLPDGAPLVVHYATRPDSLGRQQEELWKRSLDAIGIRMQAQRMPFSELLKAEKQCRLQMRTAAWIADYPDGDNFMQLVYGPNIHQSNNACAQLPDYDRLYARSRELPDSAQRNRLYRQLARLIEVYGVWKTSISRYHNMLVQPWVTGYKKHPIMQAEWAYIDLEARH